MPREFAKIKLQGPFKNQAEYKMLYAREYRRIYGKDGDRVPNYREYVKSYNKAYRDHVGHKEVRNKRSKELRDLLRLQILSTYSDGSLTCARCGYGDVRALDLDHIDHSGREYRKNVGRRGTTYEIYLELKGKGFPDGYQILCRNCNWIKEVEYRSQRREKISTEDSNARNNNS